MFCVSAISLRSLRCIPVDELVSALGREVFFAQEVLGTFDVVVRTILVLLRDPIIQLVLYACISDIYASRKAITHSNAANLAHESVLLCLGFCRIAGYRVTAYSIKSIVLLPVRFILRGSGCQRSCSKLKNGNRMYALILR